MRKYGVRILTDKQNFVQVNIGGQKFTYEVNYLYAEGVIQNGVATILLKKISDNAEMHGFPLSNLVYPRKTTLQDAVNAINWVAKLPPNLASLLITEYPENDLGTLTWAGTAPTGITKKYRAVKIDKKVTVWINITATNAGNNNLQVSFDLPAILPAPQIWSSQPNNSIIAVGSGTIANDLNSERAGMSELHKDNSGNFVVKIFTTTPAAQALMVSAELTYLTN